MIVYFLLDLFLFVQNWVANNMYLHIQNHTRQQKFMWNMELQL
jgi:hypothetical protein